MAHDSVILEADGGSRGNPGPAAYGALIRDSTTGEVIAEAAEFLGRVTNNVAEYRGLIAGLELYAEHTPDALLEVRMDSKLVIEQMAGRWRIKHPDMRPLAVRAQRLAPFGTVWTWVPRELNKAADRLANLAMDAAARGEVFEVEAVGDGPAASAGTGLGSDREDRSGLPRGVNQPGDPTPDAPEPPVAGVGTKNPMLGWNSDLGEATTLIFLRHGVTRHTSERRFSGPGGDDPALLDDGWAQAERAAAALARDGTVEAILASPLQRTRDTASAVQQRLGLEVVVEPAFREAAFGEWDGYTFAEVEERWPAELEQWLSSVDYPPPGGESITEVQRRVEKGLTETLSAYPGKTVLVVSHVTPIKLAVRYCLDAPLESIHKMLLAPASFTTVSFWSSGPSCLRQLSALP